VKTFSVNSLIDNERALEKPSNPRRRVKAMILAALDAAGGAEYWTARAGCALCRERIGTKAPASD
jgi:hypothetical protein